MVVSGANYIHVWDRLAKRKRTRWPFWTRARGPAWKKKGKGPTRACPQWPLDGWVGTVYLPGAPLPGLVPFGSLLLWGGQLNSRLLAWETLALDSFLHVAPSHFFSLFLLFLFFYSDVLFAGPHSLSCDFTIPTPHLSHSSIILIYFHGPHLSFWLHTLFSLCSYTLSHVYELHRIV